MNIYPNSLLKRYISKFGGLSKTCHLGFIFSLVQSTFIGIYYYLPIYFIEFLHLSITESGVIISCYGIGAIFGGFIGGKLSDKLTPSLVSTICLLIQGLVYIVFLYAQSNIFLMMNVCLLGVTSYGFITSNHLFTLNNCRENDTLKLKVINILSMTSNLGLGLSAMIMSGIYTVGFDKIFLFAGSLLLFLSLIFFISEKKLKGGQHSTIQDKVNLSLNVKFSVSQSNKQITILVLTIVFFIGLIVSQLSTTYSMYIRENHPDLGVKAITYLFALNSLIVVFLSVPLGDYIKNYNKMMMVGVGGFLIGYGMFILIFSNSFIIAILACVIYTIGEIIFFSMAQLLCYKNSGDYQKGIGLGLYRMVYASSRILGPSIGGITYVKYGGQFIWIASGIIGIVCLISGSYLKKFH